MHKSHSVDRKIVVFIDNAQIHFKCKGEVSLSISMSKPDAALIDGEEDKRHKRVYRFQLVFENATEEDERITCIEKYKSSIYVGTSVGRILHYHNFEDTSYMLISKMVVSKKSGPITKIVILKEIERALIVCDRTAIAFILPELSPANLGKMRNVTDIVNVPRQLHQPHKPGNDIDTSEEYAVVLSNERIRLVRATRDSLKLVKDINYNDALICTSKRVINYYNDDLLVVVADDKNYDMIDISKARKVPLLQYNSTTVEDDPRPLACPYVAFDRDNDPEFLLLVLADESTSMAMFINSKGDVTRGTLIFTAGCPRNGVVAKWPYILAISRSSTGDNNLAFYSLETLKSVYNENLPSALGFSDNERVKDDFRIALLNAEVSVKDEELSDLLSEVNGEDGSLHRELVQHFVSKEILYNGGSLWVICEVNILLSLTNRLMAILSDSLSLPDEIPGIMKELDFYYYTMKNDIRLYGTYLKAILFLLLEKEEDFAELSLEEKHNYQGDSILGALVLDPRFFISISDNSSTEIKELFIDFKTYKGIWDLIKLLSTKIPQSYFLDYLSRLYETKLLVSYKKDTVLIEYCRRKVYLEKLRESSLLVEFIKEKDTESWKKKNNNNTFMMKKFEENGMYLSLLYTYMLTSEVDDQTNESLVNSICSLSIKLLRGDYKDSLANVEDSGDVEVKGLKINLFDIVTSQLEKNLLTDKDYMGYLLEIFKLNTRKGIEYMKAHDKAKYREVDRQILKELDKSTLDEDTLANLKIDVLESNFVSCLNVAELLSQVELLDELIYELTCVLLSKKFLADKYKHGFLVLKETFQSENSLNDSIWPKVTWVDFLSIHLKKTDCSDFITIYLKVLELLIMRCGYKIKDKTLKLERSLLLLSGSDYFSYLKLVLPNDESIIGLLKYSDYSAAEHYALYGLVGFPSHGFYFSREPIKFRLLPTEQMKDNLRIISDFYVTQQDTSYSATRHFLLSYGTFFNLKEVLAMLPYHVPIACVEDYLFQVFMNKEIQRKDSYITKVLIKTDTK